MRILYVAMKYDYGDPARGPSFEHANFFDTLAHGGHELLYFDFMSLMQNHSRWWMNRRLLEVARSERPDLLFAVLYQEQFDRTVFRTINRRQWTRTVNWFCDDHWRFDSFSRFWAPVFDLAVTTDPGALPRYTAAGIGNVLLSQWAANPFTYRKLDLPLVHDVTFVGQPHGQRRALVQALRDQGLDVKCWGRGWENGRVSQEQMVEIFNQSRVNLNLANASAVKAPSLASHVSRLKDRASLWLEESSALRPAKHLLRELWRKSRGRRPSESSSTCDVPSLPPETALAGAADQIKGRNFEVPGCGGLLVTPWVPHLDQYYRLGEEVVTAREIGEMAGTIKKLLADEPRRAAIADAGYRRTQFEHTYVHRFQQISDALGLPHQASLQPKHSSVVEIY